MDVELAQHILAGWREGRAVEGLVWGKVVRRLAGDLCAVGAERIEFGAQPGDSRGVGLARERQPPGWLAFRVGEVQREIADSERRAKRTGSARETRGEATRGGQVLRIGVVRELAPDVGKELQRVMELHARLRQLSRRDVFRALPTPI